MTHFGEIMSHKQLEQFEVIGWCYCGRAIEKKQKHTICALKNVSADLCLPTTMTI